MTYFEEADLNSPQSPDEVGSPLGACAGDPDGELPGGGGNLPLGGGGKKPKPDEGSLDLTFELVSPPSFF